MARAPNDSGVSWAVAEAKQIYGKLTWIVCARCMCDFSIFAFSNIDLGSFYAFFARSLSFCLCLTLSLVCSPLAFIILSFLFPFCLFVPSLPSSYFPAISWLPAQPLFCALRVHIFLFLWNVFFYAINAVCTIQWTDGPKKLQRLIELRVKMNRRIVLHPQLDFFYFHKIKSHFFRCLVGVVAVFFSRFCIEYCAFGWIFE